MCPGVTMSDCATACPDVDSVNTDGMCTTLYTTFVMCELGDSDPCTAASNGCSGQAGDYVQCQSDFCNANPSHAGCM
jgi:hypothetical protein